MTPADGHRPLLEARELHVHRGRRHVLRGLSLAVEPGRCLGIAGPNGAGKSTLLGALAGWIHPTSGEVLLHGHPVHGGVPAEVGFAAQEVSFYPHLSGRHNLELFGQLYDLSGPELVRRVDRLVESFELEDWIEREAHSYSGGVARRLHLAIALINQPDLVLLDEPTTGLDPGSRSTLVRVIAELLEEGNAVVMVSQVLADLEIVAHRLMVIVDGRPALEDDMESVMQRAGAGVVVIELAQHPKERIDLSAVPGVLGFELAEAVLTVRLDGSPTRLPLLLDHLRRRGLRVARLEFQPASLQTVISELVPGW